MALIRRGMSLLYATSNKQLFYRLFASFKIKNISTNNTRRFLCSYTTVKRHNFSTSTAVRSYNKDSSGEEDPREVSSELKEVISDRGPDCSGCGTILHSTTPNTQGYVPTAKLQSIVEQLKKISEENEDVTTIAPPICQRCFYLKHYNTALDVALQPDEYKTHLVHLRDKRCLILCIVDVIDFPSSLFPSLNSILGKNSTIYLIGNKIDLLPDMSSKTKTKLTNYLLKEASESLGENLKISKLFLTSVKTKLGLDELTNYITKEWGNRGDVYLLGCTNVGKSSLFNHLLVSLCGVRPGQAKTVNRLPAPSPTISHWPGTTLGLVKFPIMSIGKRFRLMDRARQQGRDLEDVIFNPDDNHDLVSDDFTESFPNASATPSDKEEESKKEKPQLPWELVDINDVFEKIGYKSLSPSSEKDKIEKAPPQNRHWLIDTPGAINDIQIINYLTTKELLLFLPKKCLSPRTVILKPGQTLFLGGLSRIDYIEGVVSVYFTVFAPSYLPLHTTKTINAQGVYDRNLGQSLLKLPIIGDDTQRLLHFPTLDPTDLTLTGAGWDRIASDIILSSTGWVGLTAGEGIEVKMKAYTLNGKGLYVRTPPLFPDAVNERGKRSKKADRTMFMGRKKKINE